MTQLIFVRHGQTKSNEEDRYMGWIDEELDEVGLRQAEAVAARLSSHPIAAIFSSPLQRSIETARPLADRLSLKVIPFEGLGEIQLGPWQGLRKTEIKDRYPEEWVLWRRDPTKLHILGMDNLNDVQTRVVASTDQLIAQYPSAEIVLFTHDAVIRLFVAYVLGSDARIYRRIAVKNASLSIVRTKDFGLELALLNDTCHLRVD